MAKIIEVTAENKIDTRLFDSLLKEYRSAYEQKQKLHDLVIKSILSGAKKHHLELGELEEVDDEGLFQFLQPNVLNPVLLHFKAKESGILIETSIFISKNSSHETITINSVFTRKTDGHLECCMKDGSWKRIYSDYVEYSIENRYKKQLWNICCAKNGGNPLSDKNFAHICVKNSKLLLLSDLLHMLRVSDKELNSPEASIILKPNPKYCRLGFAVSQQGDELVLSRYIGRDDLLLFLGKDQPSYSYEEAVFSTPDTKKMAAIVRRLTDHYPKDVPVFTFPVSENIYYEFCYDKNLSDNGAIYFDKFNAGAEVCEVSKKDMVKVEEMYSLIEKLLLLPDSQ